MHSKQNFVRPTMAEQARVTGAVYATVTNKKLKNRKKKIHSREIIIQYYMSTIKID